VSALGRRAINIRIAAALLTIAQGALVACEDAWPDPPAFGSPPSTPVSAAHYLVVIPNELDVHVDDPSKDVTVFLVGKVFDKWGIPLAAEPLTFSMNPPVAGFDLISVSAAKDTTKLVIRATDATTADQTITVRVAHTTPGLVWDIPVHVMYDPKGDHGVLAPSPTGDYPAAGLASGMATGAGATWKSNLLRAFVRRARFESFDPLGVAPANDIASGAVLSPTRILWRQVTPWTGTAGDMAVPGNTTSQPAVIRVVPVHLADNSTLPDGTLPSDNFVTDVQGGADVIETSLVGAKVEISPVTVPGNKITWDWFCSVLDGQLNGLADPTLRPDPLRLMVYMVTRLSSGSGDLPLTCKVGMLPSFPNSQAIFLPVGGVESQSVAHEIAHALSQDHVVGLDFLDHNLMVVPVSGMGQLRDRLSVGQAFRAALDEKSWIVLAGRNQSAMLDCESAADLPKCPLLKADISVRVP